MSKNPDIFFIDFDETLFNHAKLNSWMDAELTRDGYIKEGTFDKQVGSYHESLTPILRLYDHERHVLDATGRDWSFIAGYLKAKIMQKPCQFCYPDSHDFLKKSIASYKDVRILSFGHGEYQRFKMGLCSYLRECDMPIHIVDRPKSKFLAEHFSEYAAGVLVDDKYPLDLPENFIHVLVDRKAKYKAAKSAGDGVVYIRSLDEYKFGAK